MKHQEQIKPDLHAQYRQLCALQQPVTSLLFGDDLPKAMKDMAQTNQVGVKLAGSSAHYEGGSKFANKGKACLGQKPHVQYQHQHHHQHQC